MRGTFEEPPTGLIPWFSKTEGSTYAAIAASPFLLQGKPMQAQDVATSWNIWKQRNREVFDAETATHDEWLRKLKEDFMILGYRINPQKLTFLEGLSSSLSI